MIYPKQIILMRTDLNMRKGKMIAQGAHASMAVFLNAGIFRDVSEQHFDIPMHNQAMVDWIKGSFTKICLGVKSQDELQLIIKQATDIGLPTSLITDNGLTEFGGVPTVTCGAIGPAYPEAVDPFTKHLKLL